MNKRIKQKKQKNHNRNQQKEILNHISRHFTIQNQVFGNGYFIFSMGESSVCHFSLKETPDWEHGIWLHEKGFDIFGEHHDLIDKFKPSRTYISEGSNLDGFLEKVKNIQENPILYFVDALTGDALIPYEEDKYSDGETWYKGYQVVREYNEKSKRWDLYKRDMSITQEDYVQKHYAEYVKDKEEMAQNRAFDRKLAFDFFEQLPTLFEEIEAVGIEDRNRNGIVCSPRYQIKLVVDERITPQKVDELYEKVDQMAREMNYSKQMKTYDHTFDLEGLYGGPAILRTCQYQYKKTS